MSMVEGGERRKRAATIMPSAEQWYDVQDDNGTWRVGFCEKNDPKFKLISLDGFHPNHSSVTNPSFSSIVTTPAKSYPSGPKPWALLLQNRKPSVVRSNSRKSNR